MLKTNQGIKYVVAGLFGVVATMGAHAQQRVIEETFIEKDPTVARQNQWTYGMSVDYFNTNNKISLNYLLPDGTRATSKVHTSEPGVSGFAGYGDITVLASFRAGTFDTDLTNLGVKITGRRAASVVDVRWLARDFAFGSVTPYALVGYERTTEKDTYMLPPSSFGDPVPPQKVQYDLNRTWIGLGGIIPVSATMGFRVDGRVARAHSASAAAGNSDYTFRRLTATMYYNLTSNVNLQVGAKSESVSGRNSSNSGAYAMLGYVYK